MPRGDKEGLELKGERRLGDIRERGDGARRGERELGEREFGVGRERGKMGGEREGGL